LTGSTLVLKVVGTTTFTILCHAEVLRSIPITATLRNDPFLPAVFKGILYSVQTCAEPVEVMTRHGLCLKMPKSI